MKSQERELRLHQVMSPSPDDCFKADRCRAQFACPDPFPCLFLPQTHLLSHLHNPLYTTHQFGDPQATAASNQIVFDVDDRFGAIELLTAENILPTSKNPLVNTRFEGRIRRRSSRSSTTTASASEGNCRRPVPSSKGTIDEQHPEPKNNLRFLD